MDKDWKTNLGEFFASNGLFRLKFLNEKLKIYCDEYVNYLNEFYNVQATIRREYHQSDINGYEISVALRHYQDEPFKLFCVYEESGHLFLRSSVDYNYRTALRAVLKVTEKTVDPYKHHHETFDEPEIYEKEYLFQLFNSRLIEYLNKIMVSSKQL
jgi:hypothetical protein